MELMKFKNHRETRGSFKNYSYLLPLLLLSLSFLFAQPGICMSSDNYSIEGLNSGSTYQGDSGKYSLSMDFKQSIKGESSSDGYTLWLGDEVVFIPSLNPVSIPLDLDRTFKTTGDKEGHIRFVNTFSEPVSVNLSLSGGELNEVLDLSSTEFRINASGEKILSVDYSIPDVALESWTGSLTVDSKIDNIEKEYSSEHPMTIEKTVGSSAGNMSVSHDKITEEYNAPGDYEEEIDVYNLGDDSMDVDLNLTGIEGIASINKDSLTIPSGGNEKVTVSFSLSNDTSPNKHFGTLKLESDEDRVINVGLEIDVVKGKLSNEYMSVNTSSIYSSAQTSGDYLHQIKIINKKDSESITVYTGLTGDLSDLGSLSHSKINIEPSGSQTISYHYSVVESDNGNWEGKLSFSNSSDMSDPLQVDAAIDVDISSSSGYTCNGSICIRNKSVIYEINEAGETSRSIKVKNKADSSKSVDNIEIQPLESSNSDFKSLTEIAQLGSNSLDVSGGGKTSFNLNFDVTKPDNNAYDGYIVLETSEDKNLRIDASAVVNVGDEENIYFHTFRSSLSKSIESSGSHKFLITVESNSTEQITVGSDLRGNVSDICQVDDLSLSSGDKKDLELVCDVSEEDSGTYQGELELSSDGQSEIIKISSIGVNLGSGPETEKFKVDKYSINDEVTQAGSYSKKLEVTSKASSEITVDLQLLGSASDIGELNSSQLTLSSGESKSVELSYSADETSYGLYNGTINLNSGDSTLKIDVGITMLVDNESLYNRFKVSEKHILKSISGTGEYSSSNSVSNLLDRDISISASLSSPEGVQHKINQISALSDNEISLAQSAAESWYVNYNIEKGDNGIFRGKAILNSKKQEEEVLIRASVDTSTGPSAQKGDLSVNIIESSDLGTFIPQDTIEFDLNLENTGEDTLTGITASIPGLSDSQVSLEDEPLMLSAGESKSKSVSIVLTGLEQGKYEEKINLSASGGNYVVEPISWEISSVSSLNQSFKSIRDSIDELENKVSSLSGDAKEKASSLLSDLKNKLYEGEQAINDGNFDQAESILSDAENIKSQLNKVIDENSGSGFLVMTIATVIILVVVSVVLFLSMVPEDGQQGSGGEGLDQIQSFFSGLDLFPTEEEEDEFDSEYEFPEEED